MPFRAVVRRLRGRGGEGRGGERRGGEERGGGGRGGEGRGGEGEVNHHVNLMKQFHGHHLYQ